MKIENTFVVEAPIDEVWETLMDVEAVAGCVPGAEVLNQLSEDAYQVGLKVKLGPVSVQYRGQVEVLERDQGAHRARMSGKAKETRGQGNAQADVEMTLAEEGGTTTGTVVADVKLSGRMAAMGGGVINDVAEQMVGQFADCLRERIAGGGQSAADGGGVPGDTPGVDERSGETVLAGVETAAGAAHDGAQRDPEDAHPHEAPVEQVAGDPDMTEGQVVRGPGTPGGPQPQAATVPPTGAGVSGGAQSMPGARSVDRGPSRATGGGPRTDWSSSGGSRSKADDDGGLDAVALARGVVMGRLQDPKVLAAVLALVALVAHRLGRRGGARSGGGGYSADDLERIIDALDRRRA